MIIPVYDSSRGYPVDVDTDWRAFVQGKLVTMKRTGPKKKPPPRRPRGECRGFTRTSRLRMLKFLAIVDWEKVNPALFITLTYPDDVAINTYAERTKQRHLFFRYMENYLQRKIAILWRLEFKARKSGSHTGKQLAHFHLLAMGVKYVHFSEVNAWWKASIHAEGYVRTETKRPKNGEAAAAYVAKYAAKADCSPSLVNGSYLNSRGRGWGIHNRSLCPVARLRYIVDVAQEHVALGQQIAGAALRYYDPSVDGSFTLFGAPGVHLGKILTGNDLDTQKVTK